MQIRGGVLRLGCCLASEMRSMTGAGILVDVRWIRSHPESRKAHAVWNREEVSNHMADRWADKAQALPPADEAYCAGGAWDVAYQGNVITGPLRSTMQTLLTERHWRHGLAKAGRVHDAEDMDWYLLRS